MALSEENAGPSLGGGGGGIASSEQNQFTAGDLSHSQSINTIASIRPEYIISEDILAGQRTDGRMSNIRRFFCLFVTFDLLFTCLMWTICVMLTGDNFANAFDKQVKHYDIQNSLFDIVAVAMCRFLVLLIFYACFYINHWIVIALSTTSTCMFLVAKVVVYDWPDSKQPVFEVLLVLVSFVLSWGEAWFLDFRVIPQENHARQFLSYSHETEREPLIRSYVQGLPAMSTYTESVGNFYSPLASPDGSVYRMGTAVITGKYAPAILSREEEESYRNTASACLEEALHFLHSDQWKFEKKNSSADTVHSMTIPSRKIYKLAAVINISAKYLFEELFYRVESIPTWNPSLLESHKIQTLDEHTDITYQISASVAAVSSRDFVTLRHWCYRDGTYVIASVKTNHRSLPPKVDKYIRGENGVGCWTMRPLDDDPSKCQFQWVLNTELNGWIPPFVLSTAFTSMMFDYTKYLRKYTAKLLLQPHS